MKNDKTKLVMQVARFFAIRNTFENGVFYYDFTKMNSTKDIQNEFFNNITTLDLRENNTLLILDNID